jgi:hypothetical protein
LFEQYFNPVIEFGDTAILEKHFQSLFKALLHQSVLFPAQAFLYSRQIVENKKTELRFSGFAVGLLIGGPTAQDIIFADELDASLGSNLQDSARRF